MERPTERPGEKLKRLRERLKLTYRDVEQASQQIAARRANDEFTIALSRLADIENKQTVPTIYRIYTLSAIYRVDFQEVLRWYGVPVELVAGDSLHIELKETHLTHFRAAEDITVPQTLEDRSDLSQTTLLKHIGRRWGKVGLSFLSASDLREHRYGFVGFDDWSMHPILRPGALIMIDQNRRKIAAGGWSSEIDRPIYFVEHRGGCLCGWCSFWGGRLIVEPHPSSQLTPSIFEAGDVDIVGQVAGVAMLLDPRKRRPVRGGVAPATSPDL
jgi:transcriptional regulator with XRE-family HTH domain